MKTPYQLFDALLEPCFVLGKDLKVVYCNETAAALCGMTVRKACRSTLRDLFTFSEHVEWMDTIEAVTEATPYKEVHFKTADGTEGKVQLTCQEIPSGSEDRHWVVFVRDVTLEERLQKKYRGELEQKEGYILDLQKAQEELEKYSKNLEKMVEERTAEIRKLNGLMTALLDALGQGFFVFDRDGLCHDFSSKACETVLEGRPNKKPVWDVLKLPENKVEGFRKWLFTLFADMLPFEDLAPLGPPTYPHSAGSHIKLEYFPLMGETGIEGVVVVASDVTSLIQAQKEAETERENARLILNLVNKRQQVSRFVRETQTMVKSLTQQVEVDQHAWDPEEIFRALHTIKGGCATYNVFLTAKASHEAENNLTAYKEDPTPERADRLRRQCAQVAMEFQRFLEETQRILGANSLSEERFIEMPIQDLHTVCTTLAGAGREGLRFADNLKRKYILESVASFFEPYADVLQNVAEKEGKSVHPLLIEGGELAVLPEVYSNLFATFVHAFRNAIDHGIEMPSARLERGKPESGTVQVRFQREGDHLKITVTDDGGGIDPARIRAKLAGKGLQTEHESDTDVIQHVFDSSFSTRDAITETSGRGVGMDAIKISAEALGGSCRVTSEIGKGTVLTVEVPWIEELTANPATKAA